MAAGWKPAAHDTDQNSSAQGSIQNANIYLLLRHAFEPLGCIRMQLKTELRNERRKKQMCASAR
jgi:hypothetical protein